MKKSSTLLLTTFLILNLSCSSSGPIQETHLDEPKKVEPTKTAQWEWAYKGEKGPKNWAKLNSQYSSCSEGQLQSPLNLTWTKPSQKNPLKINYHEGNTTISNTGYTFRLQMTPESHVVFNGEQYILEKIEFRTPSEHQLSGRSMPMEIQFYHRSPNGLKQAILSLFVISGNKEAEWFGKLWNAMTKTKAYQASPSFRFNPGNLIPPKQTFYHYVGSLTHPPCREGVKWFVFNTPLAISKEQIYAFKSIYNHNNRPIQPTHKRKIINF